MINNNNLTIKGNGICLRELNNDENDFKSIKNIIRACAARSTRKLYDAYRTSKCFKHTMLGNKQIKKLIKTFKLFDEKISNDKIIDGSAEYKTFLLNIEDVLTFFPDDNLFFPYGPIQAPFDESIKNFIELACDSRSELNRNFFRLGIEKETKEGKILVGCVTFDFNKHNIIGFPEKTICDPGIFIHPMQKEFNGIRTWQKTFFLVASFLKQDNRYKNENIKIGATTHSLNVETGNILCNENGFTEFDGLVFNSDYGERRFYYISYNDFLNNFKKFGTDDEVKIS